MLLSSDGHPCLEVVLKVVMAAISSSEHNSVVNSWMMEGLLAHFFSSSRSNYAIEDVQWLLKFINKQRQWCYLPAETLERTLDIVSVGIDGDLEVALYHMQAEVRHSDYMQGQL